MSEPLITMSWQPHVAAVSTDPHERYTLVVQLEGAARGYHAGFVHREKGSNGGWKIGGSGLELAPVAEKDDAIPTILTLAIRDAVEQQAALAARQAALIAAYHTIYPPHTLDG